MSRWWRAEETSIDHPKLLRLSDAMFRAWYTLNCIASANDGVLPPTEDIAVRLRMKPAKVAEWIAKLVTAKLYDNDGGVFRPHNWEHRQYKSDVTDPTAPQRMKRYRERKRNDRNGTVTDKRSEAEAEPDTEQSRADASTPIDENLKRKVAALQAGVSAHFVSRGQAIPNLDRCLLWLTQGYGSGTVLAAVEAVLKRGKAISTLEYFDGAIRDQHAKAPQSPLQIVSRKVFVIQGTQAWNCWQQVSPGGRGWPIRQRENERGVLQDGWDFESEYPPGYDEATGERIAPADQEENAA